MTKQEKTAVIAVGVNFTLTALKFVLASFTGSIALLAEAYHSMADIFSSVVVFAAVRSDGLSKQRDTDPEEQPRDDDNSKGKRVLFRPGAWQSRVAICIGIFLIFVGLNVLAKARTMESLAVRMPVPAAVFVGCLALLSFLLSKFELHVGTTTGSAALIADGHHARADMLTSMLVLATLLGEASGNAWDKPGAFLIALLVLFNGAQVLFKGTNAYLSTRNGRTVHGLLVVEDAVLKVLSIGVRSLCCCALRFLRRFTGFQGDNRVLLTRLASIAALTVLTGILILYLISGFYMLSPSEQAIVERFGKPLHPETPIKAGLHYHLPFPLERIRRTDTGRIYSLQVGYLASRKQPDLILWTNIHHTEEKPVLTGEYSFLDLAMDVHYQIRDLSEYLYSTANPITLFESLAYAALREEVGKRSFSAIVTSERDALEANLKMRLQTDSSRFRLGFAVVNVCLLDLHPPVDVAASFEDVVSAQEDYETFVEEAKGYRKDIIPRTRGIALARVAQARAEKMTAVQRSKGESEAFARRQAAYRNTKEVTEVRLYLETMEESLPNVAKYIFQPRDNGSKPRVLFGLSDTTPAFVESWANRPDANANPEQERTTQMGMTEEDIIETVERLRTQERR